MAYKKTYKKKAGYKKKAYKKPMRYKIADTAYTALKIAKHVKDMVNCEYKDRELVLNDTTSTNVGSIVSLVTMPQDVTNHGRVGDSIKLQRMMFRFTITKNTSATATSVRMILFRGKSENGVAYTPGSILQYQDILSPKTEDTKYNTKFIIDKTYVLDVAKCNMITREWNVPLNWHLNFQTGSSTNIKDGGLYLMILQSGATLSPNVHMIYKVTYTDT